MTDILKEIDDAIEHLHKTPIEKVNFQALFSTLRASKNTILQLKNELEIAKKPDLAWQNYPDAE